MVDAPSTHHDTVPHYILLAFALSFILWTFWIGTVLARLWYYKGALCPVFEKFDIQPEYIRNRLAIEASKHRDSTLPILHSPANVRMMDEEGVKDPVLRKQIREEKRITMLSTFVQDDGGDGSEFPNMQSAVSAEEYNRQYDARKHIHYRDVGLHRQKAKDWLAVDDTYIKFNEARETLLTRKHDECIQVTREGEEACKELLKEVVDFLTLEYPSKFKVVMRGGVKKVRNCVTREEWSLQQPYDCSPLEVCSRLCIEDFSILIPSDFAGQYILAASATCCPSGWRLLAQIGASVTNLREPVLSWENFSEVLNYFNQNPETPPLQRRSTFIQTQTDGCSLAQLLFIQARQDFFSGRITNLDPKYLVVRRERHSFRRLPKTRAIVFTVRSRVQLLEKVSQQGLAELMREIRAWHPDTASLKGKDLWQRCVYGFCEKKSTVKDDETVVEPGELTEAEDSD